MAQLVEESRNQDWHHHPALPIGNSALFAWPPRPAQALRWLLSMWLPVTTTTVWLAAAIAVWAWLQPSLTTMADLHWIWIGQLYVKNLALLTMVAGGLHAYLYILKGQGTDTKFENRPKPRQQKKFTFGNQVQDNMLWSLGSGVTVWTGYEVLYFWMLANGWLPYLAWSENPVWFAALFVVIPIWSSMHFYWVHRFLHWKPVYRTVHALHHKNVDIGPWSGISMHPVEHLIYFNSVILHFVVASHPIHMLYHLFIQALNPAASHSGFEHLKLSGTKVIPLGDFFHQLHHRYFECNYGTSTMPWDKWFGTFHDGSHTATKQAQQRMRAMAAR